MKITNNYDIQPLSLDEMRHINGGGAGFEFLGRVVGWFHKIMTEAVDNGYEHAGLFH